MLRYHQAVLQCESGYGAHIGLDNGDIVITFIYYRHGFSIRTTSFRHNVDIKAIVLSFLPNA